MTDPSSLSVTETIRNRRATRRFDPNRGLPEATLVEILGLATLAPSGFNLQPWRFLIVRSARNRRRLRACAFNQPKLTDAPVVVILLGYLRAFETDLDAMLDRRMALGASTPEAVAEIRARAIDVSSRIDDRSAWAARSAMLAAATLMIGAEALGVASAPMEGFDPRRVRDEFGVPDDHTICALIALGYALEPDPFPGRFGLEHLCYEEHFGQPWTLGEPG